ncbi:MAG: DUF1835 domain-containing protein [Candidatus Omnitrophica bacterium]|nr:DUF1835 domain-containing protein [Candidatus Omnitrophota bacterium]
MAELIITNGDSAADSMRQAGFQEEILCWKDVLHDGPVPGSDSWEDLADTRCRYLSGAFGESPEEVRKDFDRRDRILESLETYEKVSLCFEHDLYDQLQLCQILDYLNRIQPRPVISLMQSENYLGMIPPPQLPALRENERPVTLQDYADGSRFWKAFTAPDPRALQLFVDYTGPLVFLPSITKRLLQTFPYRTNGLTLTQRYTLELLIDSVKPVNLLFGEYCREEEVKYLGDWSFVKYLEELAFCPSPLIEGYTTRLSRGSAQEVYQQQISLTAAGRDVVQGTLNHLVLNGIDRWIGGTHLTPDNLYCFDPRQECLVRVDKP